MDIATIILFIPACFALNMAPGPNNLLSINNAANHGFAASCLAGVGRLIAFTIMIGITSAGLAVIILNSPKTFTILRAVGAAYLLYLAFKLWTSGSNITPTSGKSEKISTQSLAQREFIVAISNPKAILIFTAFLPQFVSPEQPATGQLLKLGVVFLALEWIAIAVYAYLGLHLQRWLTRSAAKKLFNRTCGSFLCVAALGILIARN